MNINETTQALALAQAFDNRTVGEVNIRAWHAVLGDADAADVMAAIREHYAEHTEWIMPAHIRSAVRDMVSQREMAARATGWAPGQAGVPKGEAMPEIGRGDAMDALIAGMPPELRVLLDKIATERGLTSEDSRQALMPRRMAWEREHKAFLRSHGGEPNPLYKPTSGTPCFDSQVHPPHPWAIEADRFACPGVSEPRAPYGAPSCDCPLPEKISESCPLHGREPVTRDAEANPLYKPYVRPHCPVVNAECPGNEDGAPCLVGCHPAAPGS